MRHLAHLILPYGVLVASLLVATTLATAGEPAQRHIDLKLLMLDLINEARSAAGAPEVSLSDNDTAQLHADHMLEGCFLSHWSTDGLKPYMRYTLSGGYQSNAENGSGSDYCVYDPDRWRVDPLETRLRAAMDGLMDSEGHRKNILNPNHRKVMLGIAWTPPGLNFRVVQHFEGDYLHFDQRPFITSDGILSLAGSVRNGASTGEGFFVSLLYDPPPQRLTRGQLARTYCVGPGYRIAFVTRSSGTGTSSSSGSCPDPRDAPRDAPAPTSFPEAERLKEEAYNAGRASGETQIDVLQIAASGWDVGETEFAIRADLADLLAEHGSGVYTVSVRGTLAGKRVELGSYSIFRGFIFPNRVHAYAYAPTTASGLIKRAENIGPVFGWDGVRWQGYAVAEGHVVPGSVDFEFEVGDWVWFSRGS